MPDLNFKKEPYPSDMKTVIDDMQNYIDIVDRQIYSETPFYLKDFISVSEKGNKKNTELFRKHFQFNTDNPNCLNKDIKGIYVLAENIEGKISIINVGMSKTIMRRFFQHTTGKKHNESTLGFYMAQNRHKEENEGNAYEGSRDSFPYDIYRPAMMEYIRNLRFAIVPIDNNFELYMAEVYLACHYKAYWNTFETH